MYTAEELLELSDFAKQALVMGLRTQELETEFGEDYVTVIGHPLKARCVLLAGEEQPQRHTCKVDVGMELVLNADQQNGLRSRIVGVGRSGEEAVLQAVQIMVEGGVPPVLAAIREPPVRPHGTGLTTTPDGARKVWWEAFAGPVQTATKHRQLLRDHLKQHPIINLLGSPPAFGAGPFSWLQVALSRAEDGSTTAQCVLNGNQWDAGSASIDGFQWPSIPGALIFRQFFCIKAKLV